MFGRAILLSVISTLSLAAGVIQIMPLGDSITVGQTGDTSPPAPGGYRNNLYAGLSSAGIQAQFVGSSTYNPSPLLTAAGQTAYEGHDGYLIAGTPTFPYGLYENIDNWFSTAQPNIVILMIGTNDINMGIDVPNAPQRLGLLLDKIAADDPGVRILLSTLIYTTDPALNTEVSAFNASLPTLAADRPYVSLFDNSSLLDLSGDYESTLHPNQQGYNKLGDALAAEVEQMVAPEPDTALIVLSGLIALVGLRTRAGSSLFARWPTGGNRSAGEKSKP